MHRRTPASLSLALASVAASGALFAACGGSSGGGPGAPGALVSLASASRADLSGQQSVYQGVLGSGTVFTFPAVRGQVYAIEVETAGAPGDDSVTFDVIGDSGSGLRSKSVDAPGAFGYLHEAQSQHVLVLCRPRNPFDTGIEITRLTVSGRGAYPDDRVRVNVFVTGSYRGYGAYNDLASGPDQGAFVDAVMNRVRTTFQQVGVDVQYEGFTWSADQVRAHQPGLVGPDDQTLCGGGETMASSGLSVVSTEDLDRWAPFGFPASDPDAARARGINAFIVHHFTQPGLAGLAPRPGLLAGNGEDTALAVGAFVLDDQGVLVARTADEVGTVLAHELGHFLGLLHTTTFDPSPQNPTRGIDDGIADTPVCDAPADVDGDGRVGLGDGCPDEANVMFYQTSLQSLLTPGQGRVVRALLSSQEH